MFPKTSIFINSPNSFFRSSPNTSAFDYFTPKFALGVCITLCASWNVITLLILVFSYKCLKSKDEHHEVDFGTPRLEFFQCSFQYPRCLYRCALEEQLASVFRSFSVDCAAI